MEEGVGRAKTVEIAELPSELEAQNKREREKQKKNEEEDAVSSVVKF